MTQFVSMGALPAVARALQLQLDGIVSEAHAQQGHQDLLRVSASPRAGLLKAGVPQGGRVGRPLGWAFGAGTLVPSVGAVLLGVAQDAREGRGR